jgi:Raf kinase inhibitor-like YbhB/YbcL family protein
MIQRIAALLLGLMAGATVQAQEFTLTSPDVGPEKPLAEQFVYNGFGCTGGNQSFALEWSGAPAAAKSFVVAHFDPDAMRGRGFWHWFVIDIPGGADSLPQGAGAEDNSKLPRGARQLKTSFGKAAYGGSCPPKGDEPHRYVITVYAMKVPKLDVSADATAAQALPLVEANALDKATLTYTFGR